MKAKRLERRSSKNGESGSGSTVTSKNRPMLRAIKQSVKVRVKANVRANVEAGQ
jgi:hypothetical protein